LKALLLSDYGKLTIADMPMPVVGDEDVLVRVHACGICGSDVRGYDGSSGRRVPPLIMGHEAAGVIHAVGKGVEADDLAPGARVTFDSTVSCGRCEYCRRGETNLCDGRMVVGVSCADYRRDGAFAEYVAVPARIVYRLPDAMPFEHAAVIEALSVAVHAVERKRPAPADAVLVVGCGMIGLLVIQVLRHQGCDLVIGMDTDEHRRALASRLGATDVLDAGDRDVARLTRGRLADHTFEAVGRTDSVRDAIRCTRKGGTVTLIGNLVPHVDLPLQDVVTRELSLLGSCASSGEYPATIALMASGAVDVAPLISATAPLEAGPAWFERLHRGGGPIMKVILRP
jgi:L-iditol 2-dehydrogenase